MKNLTIERKNNHNILLIVGLLGIVLTSLYVLFFKDNTLWDVFIFRNGEDLFMDFFNHIRYCKVPSKVYYVSIHACFPPLAYIFYFIIGNFLPYDAITVSDKLITIKPYAYILYIIYTILLVIILCNLISYILKKYNKKYILLLELQLFLSYSFIAGNFERGNSSFLVLILLLAALIFKDSKNKICKEIALILIAISAGFKIYPAIFGILYIFEKRYKEAIRLLVYGIALFFIPFAFFGGINGFGQFFNNQMEIQTIEVSELVVKTLFHNFAIWIGLPENCQSIFTIVAYVLSLALVVIATFLTKKYYLKLLLLTSIIVLFPSWSGIYTISYFLIPLLFFLRDEDKFSITNIGIEFAFGLIFTLIAFRITNITSNIAIFGCYFLTILGIVSAFNEKKLSKVKTDDL